VQAPPTNLAARSMQLSVPPPPIVPPVSQVPVFTDPAPVLVRDRTTSNSPPAFRSQTPERRSGITQIESPEREAPTSAGKKRRAPDHDERETVPPEGRYTSDSVVQPATTPRLRKTLLASRTGFTPVRSRNITDLPSPAKRATTTISDVTNSPRSASGSQTARNSSKRTWLGKIRGGVPQINNPRGRAVSSRMNVFEKMPDSRGSS
jgi:hypothetical protein